MDTELQSEWKVRAKQTFDMAGGLTALMLGIIAFLYVSVDKDLSIPSWLVWLVFIAAIGLLTGYLLKVRAFADVQPCDDDAAALRLVGHGLTALIAGMVLMRVTTAFVKDVNTFFYLMLATWLTMIVGCFMMKNGYRRLRNSDSMSPMAKKGAENLRYAAVCNIRLLIAPVIMLIGQAIIMLFTLTKIQGHLEGIGEFDLDTLEKPINAILASIEVLKSGFNVLMLFTLVALLLMFIWFVFAQVKPLMGWHRLKKGMPAEEENSFAPLP
ncbi:MAG: hypothetical protein K6G08_02730 [Prevotella sp.]|nr:hypothetical protein [Prevotella sp.]